MRIPARICIAGHVYTVEMRNRERDDGVSKYATVNHAEQKIWIDSAVHEEQQGSSFLHEVLEVLDYLYNLKLKHENISLLETGLYEVLKGNDLQFHEPSL